MGKVTQPIVPPGGNGGGTTPPSSGTDAVVYWLQQIYNLLLSVFGLGQSSTNIFTVTIPAATTPVPISNTPMQVKEATIQNQSATDTIVISTSSNAVSGIILNPAPAAGQGGGSKKMKNVDLNKVFVTSSTNTNQVVGVEAVT